MRSRVPLRDIYLGQKRIRRAEDLMYRRDVRLHSFRRNNMIDSTAHDIVALACRGFEPRSVDLDQAPPIGPDSPQRPQLVHDMCHGRSTYAKQLRKRLLRQRQEITVDAIVDVEQPPSQAGLHRVQRIAGGDMLELRQ
jgi:hypothetical protein